MAIGVFEKKVPHEASPVKQSIHTFLTEEIHNSQETSYSQSCTYSIPPNLYCTLVGKQFNWLGGYAAVGLVTCQPAAIIFLLVQHFFKRMLIFQEKNAIQRILKMRSGRV